MSGGIKRYGYIDALRGYAVLGVMAVHVGALTPKAASPVPQIAHDGAYGVQLFFVVSALTLCLSWRSRGDGAIPFYIRRLFRIAPAFWLAGLAYLLVVDGSWRAFYAPHGLSTATVVLTALFANGWHPEMINSIVPGGWSIAVEMTFYLVFPLLMLCIRTWTTAALAVVCTMLAVHWLNPVASGHFERLYADTPHQVVWAFAYFWFPNQLTVFLIGFLTYFTIKDWPAPSRLPLYGLFVLTMGVIFWLPFSGILSEKHIIFSVCFASIAYCMANGVGNRLLENRVIRWIGKISFSAYLWHYAMTIVIPHYLWHGATALDFVIEYGLCVIMTTALASVTYLFVERPMIKVGDAVVASLPVGTLAPRAAA
jgi:peptidoglycan/LPS O-acetylase OafA/YrhL